MKLFFTSWKLFFTSLLLVGLAALGGGAQAGVVTTLADDGTTGTLRSQIGSAAAGATITFQPGLTGTISLVAANGPLAINQSLTIQGPGAFVLAVDGGSTSPTTGVQVFSITGGTINLSGLTIQHGNDLVNSLGSGGILDSSTNLLTLTNCTLTGNAVRGGGGGGISGTSTGALMLTNCTLTSNTGGVYNASSTLTLANCTLNGNHSGGAGAGVFNSGTATLTNCALTDNTTGSGSGGGIANSGALTLTNCILNGNNAGGDYSGGGIFNSGGSLALTNCTLTSNSATYRGGGIYNNGGTVMLTNDILYNDTANGGGNETFDGGTSPNVITATYCAIQGNAGTPAMPDANHNFGTNADPQFVRNPRTNGAADFGDLHLQAISPVIGKGNSAAPNFRPTDLGGNPYASPPSLGAYEGAVAANVAAQVRVRRGAFGHLFHSNVFMQTVTLTNTSGAPIAGPLSLALDGLTANVTLTSANGTTGAGDPFQNALPTGASLASGASVTLRLSFVNNTSPQGTIGYVPRVLAGTGAR